MQYKIKKISGDASFREFYKIEKNSRFTILVKANKDKFRNLIIYAAINELLIKNKIKAPKLVQEYFVKNMMEIENFHWALRMVFLVKNIGGIHQSADMLG